jgi:hypothetical protein
MNSKLILSGVLAVVLLSGCASAPQAPKDEKEMAELGDDNLLNVPVDISGFIASKKTIYTRKDEDGHGSEGDSGQITIFTDPSTGKVYDEDGQPVNDKGERILKDGHVCIVTYISGKRRFYGKPPIWSESKQQEACKTRRLVANMNRGQTMNAVGLVVLFSGGIAGLAAIPVNTAVTRITEDDLL